MMKTSLIYRLFLTFYKNNERQEIEELDQNKFHSIIRFILKEMEFWQNKKNLCHLE